MRVLFTTNYGSGHWRPLAPLAQALVAAGHEVAFVTSPIFCAIIARHGFRCFPIGDDEWAEQSRSRQGQPARAAEPEQAAAVMVTLFIPRAGRNLPELLAVVREWRPDVIVREQAEFAGCVAAEALGLPHATVQVSAWRGDRLDGPLAAPLDRLRAAADLPPDRDRAMLYRYLLLLPFPPRFADPAAPLPPTAHHIRHVGYDIDRPGDALPGWVADLPARPVVYATLGTAYNRTPGIFPAILAGLRDEPATLIVTVGPNQDPADFGPQSPHVHIERYLPQNLLFPHCDLVVTHGGSGTVRAALDHGLPLVVIPIAADQPDNARRCADLGVGRVVAPDRRTPGAIREAVREVLHTPGYRRNAARLRDEMRALPGPEYAVALLERLALERRPLVVAP